MIRYGCPICDALGIMEEVNRSTGKVESRWCILCDWEENVIEIEGHSKDLSIPNSNKEEMQKSKTSSKGREIGESYLRQLQNAAYIEPREAYRELVQNAMNSIYVFYRDITHDPKTLKLPIYIDLNVPPGNASQVSDMGIGISYTDYENIRERAGHKISDPQYQRNILDPEYMGKIGAGLDSTLVLSRSKRVTFESIYQDKKLGTLAGFSVDFIKNDDGFNAFDGSTFSPSVSYDSHTGVSVRIHDPVPYTKQNIMNFISTVFARKLSDNYIVNIKDHTKGDVNYERILPPADFCCKHESIIGYIDHPSVPKELSAVRVDLHINVDKLSDCRVYLIVKKMTIDEVGLAFKTKGIIRFDGAEFTLDRNRATRNQVFDMVIEMVEKYLEERNCEKKSRQDVHIPNPKRRLEEALKMLETYQRNNPMSGLMQALGVRTNPRRIGDTIFDKQQEQPLTETQRTVGANKPTGTEQEERDKYASHRHRPLQAVKTDEGGWEARPLLEIVTQQAGDKALIYIDVPNRWIVINTDRPGAKMLNDSNGMFSQKAYHIALSMAIVSADLSLLPGGGNIQRDEYERHIWKTLDQFSDD